MTGHKATLSALNLRLASLAAVLLGSASAFSQNVTTDGTLGTNVTQSSGTYSITGGTQRGSNQFHSFGTFGLTSSETADFVAPSGTTNIIGRVTGGQISNINGAIVSNSATANLFLINPAGVVVGPQARIDVGGAFYASTAQSICQDDTCVAGSRFDLGTSAATLSSAPPSSFGFASGGGASLLQGKFRPSVADPNDPTKTMSNALSFEEAGAHRLDGRFDIVAKNVAMNQTQVLVAPGEPGNLTTQEEISLKQSAIETWRHSEQNAHAGNLTISAKTVVLADRSSLGSHSQGRGCLSDHLTCPVRRQALSFSTWSPGDVIVRATDLSILSGSQVSSNALGVGFGIPHLVKLDLTGSLLIDNKGLNEFTGVSAFGVEYYDPLRFVYNGGSQSGGVSIEAEKIDLKGRSSAVNAGQIDIKFLEKMTVHDSGTIMSGDGSVFADARPDDGFGRLNLRIVGKDLSVSNLGLIGTTAVGSGIINFASNPNRAPFLSSGTHLPGSIFRAVASTVDLGPGFEVNLTGKLEIVGSGSGSTGFRTITNTSPLGLFSPSPEGVTIKAADLFISSRGSIITWQDQYIQFQNELNINGTGHDPIETGIFVSLSPSGLLSEQLFSGGIEITSLNGSAVIDHGFVGVNSQFFGPPSFIGSPRVMTTGPVSVALRSLLLKNDARLANVARGSANPGAINIVVNKLGIENGSIIDATARGDNLIVGQFGPVYLSSGRIDITAHEYITIDGVSPTPIENIYEIGEFGRTNLYNHVLTQYGNTIGSSSIGSVSVFQQRITGIAAQAGNDRVYSQGVSIKTPKLSLMNGAQISADVIVPGYYQGQVGQIDARAGDLILDVADLIELSSGSSISALSFAGGAGGKIEILDSKQVSLTGGSQISTVTIGMGQAGSVVLRANDVDIESGSRIQSNTEYFPGAFGPGVSIPVDFQAGSAGDVLLVVSNSLDIRGPSSGISSSVILNGLGEGGLVSIDAKHIGIFSGGEISTRTLGVGSAGNVNIGHVTPVHTLTMVQGSISSSAGGSVTEASTAGTVSIRSSGGTLDMTASSISSDSGTAGPAGTIAIGFAGGSKSAGVFSGDGFANIIMRECSEIVTQAASALAGNIEILATNNLLVYESQIVSEVLGGTGNGGDINIDPINTVLRNAIVDSSAIGGLGGSVTIDTRYFFASESVLDLAGGAANGQLLITGPEIGSETVQSFDPAIDNVAERLPTECSRRLGTVAGTLTPEGRGGLPLASGSIGGTGSSGYIASFGDITVAAPLSGMSGGSFRAAGARLSAVSPCGGFDAVGL